MLLFQFTKHEPDFFIQLKGKHAGKPSKQPGANSIGIKTNKEVLLPEYAYYNFLHVYNTGIYSKYLKGSVIPFIRQNDIIDAFFQAFR